MRLTIRRASLLAALALAIASGQESRRLMRRIPNPPDFMDNRSVDLVRIAPERCNVEILNERMRVVRIQLPSTSRLPIHGHPPGLIVAVKDLALRVSDANGTTTDVRLPAGDMRWMTGGVHSEENIGATPAEYLYIEAKN